MAQVHRTAPEKTETRQEQNGPKQTEKAPQREKTDKKSMGEAVGQTE